MSSHHEWSEEVVAKHGLLKPYAPENGQALKYQIGDRVIFENECGGKFQLTIVGFYKPDAPSSMYARGYRYLVNSSSPWFPVQEASLRIAANSARI